MLYDEFVQGTGCRETEYNYRVYKDIETIYMNSDMTKEEAYTIGKMRVNNSLSDDEIKEIERLKDSLDDLLIRSHDLENYTYYGTYKDIVTQHKHHLQEIQNLSKDIKEIKARIKDIESRAK